MTFLILPLSIGATKFLCSDNNLLEALETPTRYCSFQGEKTRRIGKRAGYCIEDYRISDYSPNEVKLELISNNVVSVSNVVRSLQINIVLLSLHGHVECH